MSSFVPVPERRSKLSVRGMTCGNCVRRSHEALIEIRRVRALADRYATTVSVVHRSADSAERLIDATR